MVAISCSRCQREKEIHSDRKRKRETRASACVPFEEAGISSNTRIVPPLVPPSHLLQSLSVSLLLHDSPFVSVATRAHLFSLCKGAIRAVIHLLRLSDLRSTALLLWRFPCCVCMPFSLLWARVCLGPSMSLGVCLCVSISVLFSLAHAASRPLLASGLRTCVQCPSRSSFFELSQPSPPLPPLPPTHPDVAVTSPFRILSDEGVRALSDVVSRLSVFAKDHPRIPNVLRGR